MIDRQLLLERQDRLKTLLAADVPILQDVARHTGPDIAERLNLVLSEYGLLIEACLQDHDREKKRRKF